MRLFARSLRLAAALALLAGAGQAAAAELAPHRAFYKGTLEVKRAGAGAMAASGSMATSLERACDGWITSAQSIVDATLENGQTARQDLRFAGWESLDGAAYRFTSRQRVGDAELGVKGSARADGPAGPGEVEYTQPGKKTIALPPATVFPTRYLMALIEKAEAGARQEVGIMFEGAGGAGPQRAAAFIGARQPAAADAAARLGPLAARPGWRMQIGFYEPDSRSPSPDYEIEILQLDNGVVTEMLMTMGPVSLRFAMQKVEAVPAPRCQP
ncbi:MAG: DUF1849 family protein [Rhodospirillales bacterium]|nr:DUF1849 family protein [Rhodospirillales bacterium]